MQNTVHKKDQEQCISQHICTDTCPVQGETPPLSCRNTQKILSNVPQDINVSPHGGEKYMIIACIISHVAQMQLYILIACIFSKSHQKPCTQKSWRRRSRRQLFYMHRLWHDFEKMHAMSMYNFICAATCEKMCYFPVLFATVGRNI